MGKRLLICSTCAGPGQALSDALGNVPGWSVDMHPCLSVCDQPVAMAAQAEGCATYVFAGLTPDDADDIAAFAAAFDAAAKGWITDARPLGRLRFCLTARVPAP